MPAVVTDACIRCKHMECVEVCPSDAFYEGENMLVINQRECFDCGVCISVCPVGAIAFDDQPSAKPWISLNDQYSKIWPNVTSKNGQSPADADQFRSVANKFELYFSSNPGSGDVGGRMPSAQRKPCSRCD